MLWNQLTAAWQRMSRLPGTLRESFWFLPLLMTVGAALLSSGALALDAQLSVETVEELGWLYTFGPEGARAVLSTVASSMITVAALTFSITMLTIQLAATQFGPRLLRNLMRDRSTQAVLGIFVATFIYCLLVLRTVREIEGKNHVPHLSVAVGVLLALISLGMLIYFIHHIARSLRLETVLDQLTEEARETIERLYPDDRAHANSRETPGPPVLEGGQCLPSGSKGYIQQIDFDAIMEAATQRTLVVKLTVQPGDFVIKGDTLLIAWPGDECPPHLTFENCFSIGNERTPEQDLSHSSGRIVEIAQRALSSGVNDPATALSCTDRIREILVHLARRNIPAGMRADRHGKPRLWSKSHDPDEFASMTLADILRYGASEPALLARIGAVCRELVAIIGKERAPHLLMLQESVQHSSTLLTLAFDRMYWPSSNGRRAAATARHAPGDANDR